MTRTLLTLLLFAGTSLVLAQPANDNSATAIEVSHDNYCSGDGGYTTVGATPDGAIPTKWSGVYTNVWFKFLAATTSVSIEIKTGDTEGTLRQPQVSLHDTGLTELVSNGSHGNYIDIGLSYEGLTIGAWYYINVDNGPHAAHPGTFTLCVDNQASMDYPSGAVEIPHTGPWCSGNAEYTTVIGTPDGTVPSKWNFVDNNVWFKFQATTASVSIDLKTGDAEGSMRQPQLSLHDDALVELVSQGEHGNYVDIGLSYEALTVGNWYYINVDNGFHSTHPGTFTICLDNQSSMDYPSGAVEIPHTGSWCSGNAAYTTTIGTPDGSVPSAWVGVYANVWFKFQATTSNVTIGLKTEAEEGTLRQPHLSLHDATITEILSMADNGNYVDIELSYEGLTVGEWYYINVDNGAHPTHPGTFTLCMDNAASMDFPSGAVALPATTTWCSELAQYTTADATPDGATPSQWTGVHANVWFSFQAQSDVVSITLKTGDTEGTLQYPQISLHDGASNEVFSKGHEGRYNDLVLAYNGLNPGSQYYINVDNGNNVNHSGTFTLCIDQSAASSDGPESYYVNFSRNSLAPAPWNNTASVPAQGVSLNNLTSNGGIPSGMDLTITSTWSGTYDPVFNAGAVTGNDSGIYPDAVIEEYYYFGVFNVPDVVNLQLQNLDPNSVYDLTFFGSSVWNGAADNGSTNYTVNGQTVTLHVQNNSTQTVSIGDIPPNVNGEIDIALSKVAGGPVGYINAMVITRRPRSAPTLPTYTVLTPFAAGGAAGGAYFPLEKAFDGQPTWDVATQSPLGGTGGEDAPLYDDRHGYIDFGPDYADIRITATWTQYRAWSGGDHAPYELLWWDDDNDNINDNGIIETSLNFNSAIGLPNTGTELWVEDWNQNPSPITPQQRYLICKSPAAMTNRAREYAMIGYIETAPPPGRTFLLDLGNPANPTAGNWNNVTGNQNNGTTIAGLIDINGGASAMGFTVEVEADNGYGNDAGFNPDGYNGEALGYPATAVSDSYFSYGPGGTYKLTGLDPTKVYDLTIFGSRMASDGKRVGTYHINGVNQTLDAENNTTLTITFADVPPDLNNEIVLEFGVQTGSNFGYINVLEVVEKTGVDEGLVPDHIEISALKELYDYTEGIGWVYQNPTEPGIDWPFTPAEWNAVTSVAQTDGWYGVVVENGDVVELWLANSGLVGILPDSLGNLSRLRVLDVAYNELTGALPSSLGNLTRLEGLYANSSLVEGLIPAELGNCINLNILELSNNQLEGVIPGELGGLANLTSLGLEYNNLAGLVPDELTNLGALTQLALRDNHLVTFPNFSSHSNPAQIDVDIRNNRISNVYISPNKGLFNSFIYEPQDTSAINGQVPDAIEISVLRDLYENTNGPGWTNNTGWPSTLAAWDAITSINQVVGWNGVVIDSGDVIALALDGLEGNIPTSLGDLSSLLSLTVRNSTIDALPESLGSLVNLVNLAIEGTGITALPDIGTLTQLKTLSVLNNALQKIPTSIQGLSELERIFMDRNNITDSIPDWLGGFPKLQVLLLQENPNLSGEIPASFEQLASLQTLLIYQTSISGAVPEGFLSLPGLKDISLFETNVNQLPDFKLHPNAVNLRMDYHSTLIDFGDIELNLSQDGSYVFDSFNFGILRSPTEIVKITIQDNIPILNDRSGGPNTNYQWQQWNGTIWVNIVGATLGNLTLNGVDDTFIGNKYRCEMTNNLVTGLTIYSSEFEVIQVLDPIAVNYSAAALHNGTITSMQWRTTAPVDTDQGDYQGIYLLDYDDKYQLTQALWGEDNGLGSVSVTSNNYRLNRLQYDANGNIEKLRRYNGSGGIVHDFSYYYESNKNHLDYIPGHADYHYNKIGQLNEEVREDGRDKYVEYDVTGKVVAVYAEGSVNDATGEATFVETSKKVSYTYDDRGFRLTAKNHETGITTWYIRDASGNVMSIYEEKDDAGNLAQKEVPVYGSGKIGTYYPDQDGSIAYELTDHLGNVRAVMSRRNTAFNATMEDTGEPNYQNPRVEEMQYFLNLETTELSNAGYLNHTPGGNYAAYLDGNPGKIIGPAITLRVKAGNTVTMKAFGKYEDQATYSTPLAIADLADALTSSYLGLNGQESITQLTDLFNTSLTGFANTGAASTRPLAFLNFIYFDENFNQLDAQKVQLGEEAAFPPGQEATVEFDELSHALEITGDGYLYVYLSNHTPGSRVWFDDLNVTLTEDIVTQATDYYPFGSVMRRANTPNSYFEGPGRDEKEDFGQYYRTGFQGQYAEEDSETGWNSFELRMYDPAIGRWLVVDPARQHYSPYTAFSNDPITRVDPDGGMDKGPGDGRLSGDLVFTKGDGFGAWSYNRDRTLKELDFSMNIQEGTQVMMPLEGFWDHALDLISPRSFTSIFGVRYEVNDDGRLGKPIPTTGTTPIAFKATDFFVKLSNGAFRAKSGFTSITTSTGKVLSNSRIISATQLSGAKYFYATRTTPILNNVTKTWIVHEQTKVLSFKQKAQMVGLKLLELLKSF